MRLYKALFEGSPHVLESKSASSSKDANRHFTIRV